MSNHNSAIVLGGSDGVNGDYSLLEKLAATGKATKRWSCLKTTRRGDELWFYISRPNSAIVARGTAQSDGRTGEYWPYECAVGDIQWLDDPITRDELVKLFPQWAWPRATRSKTALTSAQAKKLRWRSGFSKLEQHSSRNRKDDCPTFVVLAGPEDATNLYDAAKSEKTSSGWPCNSKVRKGDRVLVYFWRPMHHIAATAIAKKDAWPGNSHFETSLRDIRWLSHPIALDELRRQLPHWRWTVNCATRCKVPDDVAEWLWDLAQQENRSRDKSKQPTRRGGGFGDAESNRIVEQAAVEKVCDYLCENGYEVESRELEQIGYDLDATNSNEVLHIEVKGVSGDTPEFILTQNEWKLSATDRAFRLYVVTNATSDNSKLHAFTGKQLRSQFDIQPLSHRATPK